MYLFRISWDPWNTIWEPLVQTNNNNVTNNIANNISVLSLKINLDVGKRTRTLKNFHTLSFQFGTLKAPRCCEWL